MFTQCAKCETVFKLSADVLRAAGGQVRCGKCGDVFNALALLAEDASAFTTGESSFDLETQADTILRSPAAPSLRRIQPDLEDSTPSGVDIARLQILDWTESDSPDAPAAPADPAAEAWGESSLEFTLPPGELDRIFVETNQGVPPRMPRAPVAQPVESAEPEEIEVFSAAAPAATASESLGSEQAERSLRRSSSPFDLAPQKSVRTFMPWLAAAITAAALLLVQVVHQNREWLAAHAPLGGSIRALYSTMGAPVAPPVNLSAYQLRQWGVTGDPAGDGALRVRASILNTAAQLEPYPLLRVTLANRFGGSIGARDFEPSEYLGKPTAKLLAPGERADATLDILDPGKSAEGFEIDVCLRGADRRVSCANDQAPAQARPMSAEKR